MARKASANALTDLMEQRSSLRTSTLAEGLVPKIRDLVACAASVFLAAMTTRAPRRARTLAVSSPIPLAPPVEIRFMVTSSCRGDTGACRQTLADPARGWI